MLTGLGERTGNADLAETVLAAKLYGVDTRPPSLLRRSQKSQFHA